MTILRLKHFNEHFAPPLAKNICLTKKNIENLVTLENIGTSHRPQIYSLYKPHLIPNFVCDDPDFLENIVKLRLERVDIFRRRNRDRTSDPWMSCFGHRTIETSPELIFHAAVMFYAQNVKCYLGSVC